MKPGRRRLIGKAKKRHVMIFISYKSRINFFGQFPIIERLQRRKEEEGKREGEKKGKNSEEHVLLRLYSFPTTYNLAFDWLFLVTVH